MRPDEVTDRLRERIQQSLGDGFIVERELRGGGMSRIFVALEVALGRRIAVKLLAPDLGAGVNVERFRREIAITASLQHPHIVPVFTAGETEGLPYYTMPLVDGESLAHRLAREGPLPVAEAVRILQDVARALAYAHERGVIHRDIKPQNVLLTGSSATVTDFGIAKAIAQARHGTGTELTSPGFSIGTPAYMAPEQAAGDQAVDHRADLYAFGCLAYEMLVEEPPFERPSVQALVAAHLVEEPTPIAARRGDVPPLLADVVMRCLEKDPDDRPGSAEEIVALLSGAALPAAASRDVAVTAATPSVAVLAFTNMSEEPGSEFFSDGVSEEILNRLARVRSLRVAARTSSFAFKGQRVDVGEIGRRLKVDAVLEGSVRRSGTRVRIAARLLNASDGYQIWADEFDRELRDVFAIQDEIASAIATALTAALADWLHPDSTRIHRTTSVEAYELYLKGRYFLNQRLDGMWKAMEYYRRALEKDPAFALAHAGVAEAHFLLTLYAAVPPREGAPQARDAARRALALDPTLAEPHTVLANVSLWYDWNAGETLRQLNRAVELKPSDPLAQSCYGYYFGALGLFDEAIARVHGAVELDPLSMWAQSNLAVTSYLARRFDDAIAQCRTMIELSPGYSEAHRWMALAQLQKKCVQAAFEGIQTAVTLSHRHFWPLANLGGMLGRAGRESEARAVLAELEDRAKGEYVPSLAIATVHYGLNDLDRAFVWLERALEERDFWLLMLAHDPGFDFLRTDPRFTRIVARVGVR